jgi:(1->4)-alpha-D-glucan 1-alpha-D-glucosylmutase
MRVPTATYRLQLNPRMTFLKLKGVVQYLCKLGISDIYSSPILKSRKGSRHGYDVTDPTIINPELGGETGFRELAAAVSDSGMGWIQDIVPNHMALDSDNRMLMDVLEKGTKSRFFRYFDVTWDHHNQRLKNKLLVPVLGHPLDECLEKREIQLGFGIEGIDIRYYDHRFPLSLPWYEKVLLGSAHRNEGGEKGHSNEYGEFLHTVREMKNILLMGDLTALHEKVCRNKEMLWKLFRKHTWINKLIRARLGIFNGEENHERSIDLMRKLLGDQWYRLAYWKDSLSAVNYRRFFDINSLISLRVESEEVFKHTHSAIVGLVKKGYISGLRIDHIDGLYDPLEYLQKLRSIAPNVYIVVEKILDFGEELPENWPVQGTTGYDFLNCLNGIFCRKGNQVLFSSIYEGFTRRKHNFPEVVYKSKKLIARQYLNGDIDNLVSSAEKLINKVHTERVYDRAQIKRALIEVLSLFPVYRTYINRNIHAPADRRTIRTAFRKVREHNGETNNALEFLEHALTLDKGFASGVLYEEIINFIMKFQQLTGPLMAKGFEDTALYRYNRLLSLDEVGGNPERFGMPLDEYHRFVLGRFEAWPHTMNATSTHDTKRGEDARARINVLSEIPEEWESMVVLWSDMNAHAKETANGVLAPDRNDEYLLYQAMIGVYPFTADQMPPFMERIKRYMIKAVREAKRRSSWVEPDIPYEEGISRFISEIIKRGVRSRFMESFVSFQKKIAFYGIWNSLSQLLVKLASPGIPDIYQGSELWNLSLVDPDNRSDVDFDRRISLMNDLKELEKAGLPALVKVLLSHREDGRIKLYVTWKVLDIRKKEHGLFLHGDYIPIKTKGKREKHVICFARVYGGRWGIILAPRFITSLVGDGKIPVGEEVWEDTCIVMPLGAPRAFKDVFTGRSLLFEANLIPVHQLLAVFPLSLLLGEVETI